MTQIHLETSIQNKHRFYNVIVAGAGNGGLVAAAILAKKGVKVLLLEQHNLPGGFASSFVRGRFEFETSLHELSSMGEPDDKEGIRRIFEDQLGIEESFIKVPEAYRIIIPEEGINTSIPFGVENFIEAIEKVVNRIDLTEAEMKHAFDEIMTGQATQALQAKRNLDEVLEPLPEAKRAAVRRELRRAVEAFRDLLRPLWVSGNEHELGQVAGFQK